MGDRFDDGERAWDDDRPISAALGPGEKIVWTGEPTSWTPGPWSWMAALSGLMFLGFGLFMLVPILLRNEFPVGKGRPFKSPSERAFFACFSMAAAAYGVFLLLAPVRAFRRARRTSYMLTNRRALVLEPGRFGGRRLRAFSPVALKVMRCAERADGSGDLVFDRCKDAAGVSQPVGFVGIDRVRDVEGLVRRALIDDASAASTPSLGVWRLRAFPRWFIGFYFSVFVLFFGAWAVVGPLMMLFIVFGLAAGRPFEPSFLGVLVGVPLLWLALAAGYWFQKRWLLIPFKIEIHEDRTVVFRNWFQKRVVPIDEIVSLRVGGWLDPVGGWALLRHQRGSVNILNDFPNFGGFAGALKTLNPSIDVRVF